jgi:hypothetical protein
VKEIKDGKKEYQAHPKTTTTNIMEGCPREAVLILIFYPKW